MDNYVDVLEVHQSEHTRDNVRAWTEQPASLTVDDLSLLQIKDVEMAKGILEEYANIDVPRENIELFKQHLFQRMDSWFVQVGDIGLVYLTNIIPTFTANLQVIFWDRRFGKNRRELVKQVIRTAIEEFELTRIQAFVPATNGPLANVELRKIGFVQEGVLRRAWREGDDQDLVVFGLLEGESSTWQSVAHLMTSSAART